MEEQVEPSWFHLDLAGLTRSETTLVFARLTTFLILVFCAACCPVPVVSKVVFQDGDRLVRLDVTYRRGGQENSHPAVLTETEIESVLGSIMVRPRKGFLQYFSGKNLSTSQPAFSDEIVQFLAPLAARALHRATELEEVVFYLDLPRDAFIHELTSGGLYVRGDRLHLILANYRHATTGPREIERVRENPLAVLGESWYELIPGPYGVIGGPRPWFFFWTPLPQHLVIDYTSFLNSVRGSEEEKSPPQGQGLSPGESIYRKFRDLNALRKEGLITEEEFREKRKKLLNSF